MVAIAVLIPPTLSQALSTAITFDIVDAMRSNVEALRRTGWLTGTWGGRCG